MKFFTVAIVVFLFAVVAAPACAQSVCIDSPENPTAVLALVGSAGGILVALRSRLRRR
jgi:XrtJ-associated TM-motif-TM protein